MVTLAAPIALIVVGSLLAVYGFTRRPRPGDLNRPDLTPALRLIFDLIIGVIQVIGFAAFVLGPRHAKVPDRLTYRKAQDVVAGRATHKTRPGGK